MCSLTQRLKIQKKLLESQEMDFQNGVKKYATRGLWRSVYYQKTGILGEGCKFRNFWFWCLIPTLSDVLVLWNQNKSILLLFMDDPISRKPVNIYQHIDIIQHYFVSFFPTFQLIVALLNGGAISLELELIGCISKP